MNGADSLVKSLLASGVDTCFANPGTSEMHFVAALDRIPGMHCVLGLFEGVVTGAADGYGRMAEKPAATLLHCGPGLANGLANLHNARRARTPIVNIVGDQATYHRPLDAPLTADTEGWARPVSGWVRTAMSAAHVGADAAAAVQAATARHRVRWQRWCCRPIRVGTRGAWWRRRLPVARRRRMADAGIIANVARVLRSGEPALILLGGKALREAPLALAGGIIAATGARMLAETQNARISRGRGRMPIERVPYPVDLAIAALAGLKHIILVGSKPPVGFFAYPGKPGRMYPADCTIHVLTRPDQDGPAALAALAAKRWTPGRRPRRRRFAPEAVRGKVTSEGMSHVLAALLPENAIVVDESVSFGRGLFPLTHAAAPHDWLHLTGGAIGEGLPMSVGAAVAAPGRRVVTLQADGSAMYTVQALWTQAREKLDVTTVILANQQICDPAGRVGWGRRQSGAHGAGYDGSGQPGAGLVPDCQRHGGGGGEGRRRWSSLRICSVQANRRSGPFLIELMI